MEGLFYIRDMFLVSFQLFSKKSVSKITGNFFWLKIYFEQHRLNFNFFNECGKCISDTCCKYIFDSNTTFCWSWMIIAIWMIFLCSKLTCSIFAFRRWCSKCIFDYKISIEGLDFKDFYNKHLYCLDILGNIFAQDFFLGGNLYRCISPL